MNTNTGKAGAAPALPSTHNRDSRRLREKALPMNLVKESGLAPADFAKIQKAVAALRDNLIKTTKNAD